MKKLYLASMVTLLSATSNVMAAESSDGYLFSDSETKPFAELKYQNIQAAAKISTSTQSASDSKAFDALAVSFGIQFGRYFGIDANFGKGISKIKERSESTTYSTNLDSYFGAGIIGFIPVSDKFSLNGEVGERHYNFTVSDGVNNVTGSDNHPYYSIGAQYKLKKAFYLTANYEHMYDRKETPVISGINVKTELEINSFGVGVRFDI